MNDAGNQNQGMSSLFDFVNAEDFSKIHNDEIFQEIERRVKAIKEEVDRFYSVPDFKGYKNWGTRADAIRCIGNHIMYLRGDLGDLEKFYDKYYKAITEGKIK